MERKKLERRKFISEAVAVVAAPTVVGLIAVAPAEAGRRRKVTDCATVTHGDFAGQIDRKFLIYPDADKPRSEQQPVEAWLVVVEDLVDEFGPDAPKTGRAPFTAILCSDKPHGLSHGKMLIYRRRWGQLAAYVTPVDHDGCDLQLVIS